MYVPRIKDHAGDTDGVGERRRGAVSDATIDDTALRGGGSWEADNCVDVFYFLCIHPCFRCRVLSFGRGGRVLL